MKLSILKKELKFLTDGVLHAVEVNSYNPEFQQALFEVKGDTLSIVIMASTQLAMRSIGICNHENENAVVNIDTLNAVYRCLSDDGMYVVIESNIETNTVEFRFDKFSIKSELGKKFLNYRNFLPATQETYGNLSQVDLVYKALKPKTGKRHKSPMPLQIEKHGKMLYFLLLKDESANEIVLKFDIPLSTYCNKDSKLQLDINKLLAMLEVVKNCEAIELKFHDGSKGLTIYEPKSNLAMWLLPIR